MKEELLLVFGLSLTILSTSLLPAFAQSERHPTEAEVRELMNRFQRQTQATGNEPTLPETTSRHLFVSAWSKVEPSLAPFLGEWYMGQDTSYASVLWIYPSTTRGRVCIIHGYFPDGDESSTLSFVTGSVETDQIRIAGEDLGRSLLVKQGNDLALLGIYNEGADVFKYSFPRPLKPPTTASLNNAPEASNIIQEFKAAGCTASLPANSQIAIEQLPSPVQVYRDTRELGIAQFLQGNQELNSAKERLQSTAQGQYTTLDIPQSDFMTETFTTVASSPGAFFGERDDISYADYLQLKLKLKEQETVLKEGTIIIEAIDQYNAQLNKDNRYGGRDVSKKIVSNFNEFWARVEEQNKKPSLSIGSIAGALPYALEETRISTINLIEGSTQTGGKLASAFTNLGGLAQVLNLPELTNPNSFTLGGRTIDYVIFLPQKLAEIQDEFLAGNIEKVYDVNLEILSETIKLTNTQNPTLVRVAEAIAIREEATELIDRFDFIKQPQFTEVLDEFDKIYLATSQFSSTIKLVTSTLALIAPGKQTVRTFADKADAVNSLLFNALQFSYEEDVRTQFEQLKAKINRNQELISGLSSTVDFSAEEVGQYLIRTRTDVVTRRPDGTIAVSTSGVLYPR
jgi:hypothetical protein